MLRSHPQIYMPEKETWYFASELRVPQGERVTGARMATLEEYLALFAGAGAGQRIGEATPSYLRSQTAAAKIAEMSPRARIVALLREPASFLRSLHMQFVQTHVEVEPNFAKALALEADRREGRRIPPGSSQPQSLLYANIVRYVEQLERYRSAFSAEQVLVLIYDDFRGDNEGTTRRVLAHLEVDTDAPIEVVEANPTVRVRSGRLHELVRSTYIGSGPAARIVKAGVKTITSQRLRREMLKQTRQRVVFADPHPPDERVMLELRRQFKGEVERLSEYLDRDLVSLWGYDEL